MTSLPASDPGSAAVWGSKRINPPPQFCLCLAWSGCPSNDDDDEWASDSRKSSNFAKSLKKNGFKASNDWLNRFKTRHSISQAVICRESGCVDEKVVQSSKSRLPDITAGYATCDIYNKQLLQTGCSKAKFANTTTPLTRPLDDGPVGGQVSGVPL